MSLELKPLALAAELALEQCQRRAALLDNTDMVVDMMTEKAWERRLLKKVTMKEMKAYCTRRTVQKLVDMRVEARTAEIMWPESLETGYLLDETIKLARADRGGPLRSPDQQNTIIISG